MNIQHFSSKKFNNLSLELTNSIIINFSKDTILNSNLKVINFTNIIEGNPKNQIPKEYTFFTENSKIELLDFLSKNKFSNIYCICDAGLCRSFSVAISLRKLYNLEIKEYILNNNCLPDKNIITILQDENFYNKVYNIYSSKKNIYDKKLDNLFN